MEIVIEFKKFSFCTLVSSVLFRVQEFSRKWHESVDLNINEVVWLIFALRSISSKGFGEGVWRSLHFHGRRFSVSCRRNNSGTLVSFEIFGDKYRLKHFAVPMGVDCTSLIQFTRALATTTVGPEKPSPATGSQSN